MRKPEKCDAWGKPFTPLDRSTAEAAQMLGRRLMACLTGEAEGTGEGFLSGMTLGGIAARSEETPLAEAAFTSAPALSQPLRVNLSGQGVLQAAGLEIDHGLPAKARTQGRIRSL